MLRIVLFAHLNGFRHRNTGVRSDPFSIISIDPRAVTHWIIGITKVAGATWRKVGTIEGGDWDRRLKPFEERTSYRSLHQHFVERRPWQDTEYYATHVYRIEEGHVRWGCLTREDFDRRCENIDSLYESIRLNGYKLQQEILDGRNANLSLAQRRQILDEVVVCIGRSGELLFADGQHRLSIAKILRLPEMPVRVLVRHSEWQAFRTRVARAVAETCGGILPHALPHPDLRFLEPIHQSDRWAELVTAHMSAQRGRLLEVQAGISGFFSDFFEQRGWCCEAWEDDPRRREVLHSLRDANGRSFNIINSKAVHAISERAFDAVVWITDMPPDELPPSVCREVARVTGGELFLAVPACETRDIAQELGNHLVNQFAFDGYEVHSGPVGEGRWSLLKLYRDRAPLFALPASESGSEAAELLRLQVE